MSGWWRESQTFGGSAPGGGPLGGSAGTPAQTRRRRLTFTIGLFTMMLSLGSGLATYIILTGLTPIVPTHRVVVGMLLVNLVFVLAMAAIIAWQVTGLWLKRRPHKTGRGDTSVHILS